LIWLRWAIGVKKKGGGAKAPPLIFYRTQSRDTSICFVL
jgi:hypothetical protein